MLVIDPRAVAVSRYGWLKTSYGWLEQVAFILNTEINNSFVHRVHQKVRTICLTSAVTITVTVTVTVSF